MHLPILVFFISYCLLLI